MRVCNRCKEEKALSEYHKDSRNTLGLTGICKACRCKATALWQTEQKKNNLSFYLARRKSNNYKQKYDLTLEEVKVLKEKQQHKCLICNCLLDNYVVDHDHVTGKVRGILCSPCNMGLGHFKDSIQSLQNAITYLNKVQ